MLTEEYRLISANSPDLGYKLPNTALKLRLSQIAVGIYSFISFACFALS